MRQYNLEPRYDSRKSFYGKAVVKTEDEKVFTLYSYNTKVCEIDNDTVRLYNVANLFSSTTLRHIKEFLKQHDFKADSKAQIRNDYELVEV